MDWSGLNLGTTAVASGMATVMATAMSSGMASAIASHMLRREDISRVDLAVPLA